MVVFRVLLVGGLVLSAAACGGKPPAVPSPLSAEQVATRASCEALGQAYDRSMAPFAEALTGMVNDRTKGKDAQQALRDLATAVSDATGSSGDAQLRTDGKRTADSLSAKAADKAFFTEVRTAADAENVLGPRLKEWLSPVTRHCS